MKNFTVYYNNIRGLKGKEESLKDYIKELNPTVICLVETHLDVDEKWTIEGYEPLQNNRDADGGGVLIAVKKDIAKITQIVRKEKKTGESLWIVINNKKIQIRIGLVYAPQESRTKKAELKKMYDVIEKEIAQADNNNQHLLLMGDFNSKVGKEIPNNPIQPIIKGGNLLINVVQRKQLHILSSLSSWMVFSIITVLFLISFSTSLSHSYLNPSKSGDLSY